MASKNSLTKKVNFAYIHKLAAGVSLVVFIVVILAGVMGGARTITIAYRAAGVIIVVGVISRIVLKILASYEEMHGGET